MFAQPLDLIMIYWGNICSNVPSLVSFIFNQCEWIRNGSVFGNFSFYFCRCLFGAESGQWMDVKGNDSDFVSDIINDYFLIQKNLFLYLGSIWRCCELECNKKPGLMNSLGTIWAKSKCIWVAGGANYRENYPSHGANVAVTSTIKTSPPIRSI